MGALPDSYTAPVASVNGQTGAVVLDADDVGALPIDGNAATASDLAAGAVLSQAKGGTGGPSPGLTFTAVSVAASAFTADATYTDFPYAAAVACAGVTAAMFAEVVLSPTDALGGNYAPVCLTGAGTVTIYAAAAPSAALTIPTIHAWR